MTKLAINMNSAFFFFFFKVVVLVTGSTCKMKTLLMKIAKESKFNVKIKKACFLNTSRTNTKLSYFSIIFNQDLLLLNLY